jgi:uncharacterized Zn-binding protein involved in type VI secretion
VSGAPSRSAARLHDPVAHSHALGGFLGGALVGLAAAAGVAVVVGMAATVIALEVTTAGLATPLVAGVAVTVGEFAVNAVVGGQLMGLAEDAGEALGSQSMGAPSGEIGQGSPDVSVNGLPAARVTDTETCDAGKVAQGSTTVFVNRLPAARVGDKVTCGAVIVAGSGNVFIGGGTTSPLPIQSEVPEWARWAAVVVGILPALGGAARAIGPALAEIEATGFARAAQTGVKALGRQMEARAGGLASGRPGMPPESRSPAPDVDAPPSPKPTREWTPAETQAHLGKFESGVAKIVSKEKLDEFGGVVGPPQGTFVLPKSSLDNVVSSARLEPSRAGQIAKLEESLSLDPGTLGPNPQIVTAESNPSLHVPTGLEPGANADWIPTGYTKGGVPEAIIGQLKPGSYSVEPF